MNLYNSSMVSRGQLAVKPNAKNADYTGPQTLGLYWTGLTLLNVFPFLVNFFSFGSCGRLSWLNCQLSSAR